MQKILTIKQRILYFAEIKKITKQKICVIMELSYGNFTGKNANTPINSKAITNLLANFPDINLDWLFTGVGNPLKETSNILKEDPILYGIDIKKIENDIAEMKKEISLLKKK
jgi:hypothetical protein